MKIGIFGGSFNPPHNMHLNIALNLINNNYLNKVIFIPTSDKYNKKHLIKFTDRFNMLNIISNKYNNLQVSDYEQKHTLIYTYQTLDYFKKEYPNSEIYFICGTDNLKELRTWKNYKYILNNYKLLVIKRNNDNIEDIIKEYKEYKDNIIFPSIKTNTISSTFIREKIKSDNYNLLNNYLDIDVLKYIKDNNLYK